MTWAGNGLVDVLLLEVQHRLQPLALARIFKQGSLFQPQPVDGVLQVLVLLAHVAQVDVVLPEAAHAGLGVLDSALQRATPPHWPTAGSAGRRSCRPSPGCCVPASMRRTCMASPMIWTSSKASSTSRLR